VMRLPGLYQIFADLAKTRIHRIHPWTLADGFANFVADEGETRSPQATWKAAGRSMPKTHCRTIYSANSRALPLRSRERLARLREGRFVP